MQRALRDTGADGIELSTEAGEAPWSRLDPADQDSADQTRALVEEFEDGVRRALARLDQFATGPADPVTLFERRSPVPGPRRSGDNDTARPAAPAAPARRRGDRGPRRGHPAGSPRATGSAAAGAAPAAGDHPPGTAHDRPHPDRRSGRTLQAHRRLRSGRPLRPGR